MGIATAKIAPAVLVLDNPYRKYYIAAVQKSIILEIYNLITVIVVIAAVFGYINLKFIKLPATIGIMLISVIVSLIVIGIGSIHPKFFYDITNLISNINFYTALMQVMLGFLLFAGAMHVDAKKMQEERISI